jgi:hypothetical protein
MAVYDLLKKSFNHSRLVCSCYEDNFSVYNGFYLHEIEESSIKEWVDHGPILIKNPCAYCAGEGESITEINKTCDLCSGHGYTADTIKKDASLCEQCGGFGIFKERNARSCESCSGIGFKPAVYSLEYADVQAPYDEFLEYGKYDNLDRTQICCIACPSCDRGYEYSTIIHNKKYTPKEWRSISLVQRGLLKFENFDIDTDYEIYTLKKLRDEFPHCQLLNKLMDISLSEDSIFTFKARYTPALNEGDISAVHLDVKLQIICDRCLGCDTLGIPYPGTESLHTEYGTPAAGTIRLFRSKRMK